MTRGRVGRTWILVFCVLLGAEACSDQRTESESTTRHALFFGHAAEVSGGTDHSCARLGTAGLVCWGNGQAGQLGNGANGDSPTPVAVSALTNVPALSAGDHFTCAIRSASASSTEGEVVCWGSNTSGTLGIGASGGGTNAPGPSTGINDAVDVAAGSLHACAVRATGGVLCWGSDSAGMLGNGAAGSSTVPVPVADIDNAVSVALGAIHTCALLADHQVACWGSGGENTASGPYSALGNGSLDSADVPVLVPGLTTATAIAAGAAHTCALRADGGVECWGFGAFGQLGNSGTTSSTTRVAVTGLTDATAITAGRYHTCAIRVGGQVVCWGFGSNGQLGYGGNQREVTEPMNADVADAVAIAAGALHTCVVRQSGEVVCFGDGSLGQLGNGGFDDSPSSVRVVGLSENSGDACSFNTDCLSGFCVDDVCCNTACGEVCQACSSAAGSPDKDGICANLPASFVCRARAGVCDIEENCTGTSPTCPDDRHDSTTVCRMGNGPCDLPETCDGTLDQCPDNAVQPQNHVCHKGIDFCETTEVCSGIDATCPDATPLPADQCEAVPAGTTVAATLNGWRTDNPALSPPGAVLVGFTNATTGGNTSATPTGSGPPAPSEYRIVGAPGSEHYWVIETSVSYTGDVTVCIIFDPTWMLGPPEGILLEHWNGTSWQDITDPSGVVGNMVCGTTETLSPFALMERLDTVPPVFSGVPGPITAYAASTAGTKVSYTPPSATDAVSGPRTVSCAPASGSTFAPGKTTVTCSATDTFHNTSTASFTVWVQYQAPADGSFFLKPIRANGSSVFCIGRPVPVKFQLTGASKGIANLVAHLIVTKISDQIRGTANDESDEDGDETDFLFKLQPNKKQYGYRWKTRGETQGTYLLRADLGDEVVHQISVSLKAPR